MFRRTLYMYGEIIFLSIAVSSIWCNSIVDATVAAAAVAVVAVVIIYAPSAFLSHFLYFFCLFATQTVISSSSIYHSQFISPLTHLLTKWYPIKQFKFICARDQSFLSRFLWLISSICAYCFHFCRSFWIVSEWCISLRFNRHGMNSFNRLHIEYEMDIITMGPLFYISDFQIIWNVRIIEIAIGMCVCFVCVCALEFYIYVYINSMHCTCIFSCFVIQLPQEFQCDPLSFASNANTFIYS